MHLPCIVITLLLTFPHFRKYFREISCLLCSAASAFALAFCFTLFQNIYYLLCARYYKWGTEIQYVRKFQETMDARQKEQYVKKFRTNNDIASFYFICQIFKIKKIYTNRNLPHPPSTLSSCFPQGWLGLNFSSCLMCYVMLRASYFATLRW